MGGVVDHPATQPKRLRPPEHLGPEHDATGFESGIPELDAWLRERAAKNDADGGSRTYVVCEGDRVIGFYCLANGAVMHATTSAKVRRNMPDPIPVMLVGRMAVDRRWQRKGLGAAMLRDAILRTLQAAEIAGIRAILVHAKTEAAKSFYERAGFRSSPVEPRTLMITLADAKRAIGSIAAL